MAIGMGKLKSKETITLSIILWKKVRQEAFQGILHRFVNDPEFRASQLEHDRNEKVCIKMNDLACKDFSHYMTHAEYFRYRRNSCISLKKSGKLDHWGIVLTSTKRCLHLNRLGNDNSGPCPTGLEFWWNGYLDEIVVVCYWPMSRSTGRNLGRGVIRTWDKIHLNVNHLMHDNWVAYFRTSSRRSLFSGRAPTCRDQSNVWSSQMLLHVIPKFETKILRSDIFVQVNLMTVVPTLGNLRIRHKKRQSGKSKVPAKQRGSWPKVC